MWAHTAVQRNPGNYQQRLEAGTKLLPTSSRTSGTLDTLPQITSSPQISDIIASESSCETEIENPSACQSDSGVGFCSEANVVATEWRLKTATTKLGTNSVCNV